jgi:hypothetical protein
VEVTTSHASLAREAADRFGLRNISIALLAAERTPPSSGR